MRVGVRFDAGKDQDLHFPWMEGGQELQTGMNGRPGGVDVIDEQNILSLKADVRQQSEVLPDSFSLRLIQITLLHVIRFLDRVNEFFAKALID